MSLNLLGEKKTRALARRTGLDLTRVTLHSHGNHWIVEGRTSTFEHYYINRRTGEIEKIPAEKVIHWTSCYEVGCAVRAPLQASEVLAYRQDF